MENEEIEKDPGVVPDWGHVCNRCDDQLFCRIFPIRSHQMALPLDEMKVVGDGAGIFIAVFLIAVLVVLIIYATGHKIVFK